MEQYEKLGAFYLGRPYDLKAGKPAKGVFLYDSKDLVTHGICVGMTGSGKTGLCVDLLEEAAMDGIPAIVIDPKGDMANLMLTFPDLKPEDFRPWIDEDEARRKDMTADAFAESQAQRWREGLASWDQDGERIRKLRETASFVLYTPGSTAARPVSILKTFDAPNDAVREDSELLREQAAGTAASLLGLIGEDADPIQSRAFILLSNLILEMWNRGEGFDLSGMIHLIQKPPFDKVGVMDLESFYPSKDRFALALRFNNLLASPTFASWLQGDPLDIDRMLHATDGKPTVSILSIAHLSDPERMFFVSLLLNQVLSWMRQQTGTGSLRAILYMDEIHGFFPPVANPPSKAPMLSLLRQARAYGLGVMLTTQNPVDLDYKGLSNTGTWFIGRLQTERDKARVLEGLEGAVSSQGVRFDRAETERILAGLGSRVFLMHNVHDDAPTVFETRWCMSYLRGPMSRTDFAKLGQDEPDSPTKTVPVAKPAPIAATTTPATATKSTKANTSKSGAVSLPTGIEAFHLPLNTTVSNGSVVYQPALVGFARVGFLDKKTGIQSEKEILATTPLTDTVMAADWTKAAILDFALDDLEKDGWDGSEYAALPESATQSKNFTVWKRHFADWVYRSNTLELFHAPGVDLYSEPGESERDFKIRIQQDARELRDDELEKLRKKYAPKLVALEERIRKSEQAVERESQQAKQQKMQTAISFGATLMSAFLGKKKISASSVGRATTAIRGASRSIKERGDVDRSKETVETLNERLDELEETFRTETDALTEKLDPKNQAVEPRTVRPLKRDVQVGVLAVGWIPYVVSDTGIATPAWE